MIETMTKTEPRTAGFLKIGEVVDVVTGERLGEISIFGMEVRRWGKDDGAIDYQAGLQIVLGARLEDHNFSMEELLLAAEPSSKIGAWLQQRNARVKLLDVLTIFRS